MQRISLKLNQTYVIQVDVWSIKQTQACDPGKLQFATPTFITHDVATTPLLVHPVWLSRLLTWWQGCLLRLWHWELDTDRGAWELSASGGPVVSVLRCFIDMVVWCCEKCWFDGNPGTRVLNSLSLSFFLLTSYNLQTYNVLYYISYITIHYSWNFLDHMVSLRFTFGFWAPPGWTHQALLHLSALSRLRPSDRMPDIAQLSCDGFLQFRRPCMCPIVPYSQHMRCSQIMSGSIRKCAVRVAMQCCILELWAERSRKEPKYLLRLRVWVKMHGCVIGFGEVWHTALQ